MAGILGALANLAFSGVGTVAGFQLTLRAQQNLQPHPLPHQFAPLLEHPWRLQYLDVAQALDMVGVAVGMKVLDLGCGTGLFTRAAAHMVGESGHIHAVDIQAAMLALAGERMAAEGVNDRVSLHHCGAYELPLPDDSVDVALVITTLGEVPDKPAVLNELRRVLKPGARLGISDEWLNPAVMLPGTVRRLATESGFQLLVNTGAVAGYHEVFINAK